MFLTGDQIYADESAAEQLDLLQSVSRYLLGGQETITVDFPKTRTIRAGRQEEKGRLPADPLPTGAARPPAVRDRQVHVDEHATPT